MDGMKVAVIMGSKSDFPALKKAIDTLKDFQIEVEARVISAHRTPDIAANFAKEAIQNGISVIIAAAGKAAHLAGILAANTVLPVIGVPVQSSLLDGLDSLLSTVQMPEGVPVATVAVNGAANAALLAVQILAAGDEILRAGLIQYRQNMEKKVLEADRELQGEI